MKDSICYVIMAIYVSIYILIGIVALFGMRKKKKVRLVLHRGGRYDKDTKFK